MTDFNKLADALESNSRFVRHGVSSHGDAELMLQAARILRAAGAADVQGLMALHDAAAEARRVLVRGGNVPQEEADRSRQSRAALESALRVALAPPPGFVMVQQEAKPEITCDDCSGSGRVFVGYSGLDSDGNAALSETCDQCGGSGEFVPDAEAYRWLMPDDLSALRRFYETCEDNQPYDVPKDHMKRLAELGAVCSHGFGKYSLTAFGGWLLDLLPEGWPKLPLKTHADHDEYARAMIAAAQAGAQEPKP